MILWWRCGQSEEGEGSVNYSRALELLGLVAGHPVLLAVDTCALNAGGSFYSLSQLEGVELFRRSSEVAELIGGRARSRKREGGKWRSEQGIQVIDVPTLMVTCGL